MYKVIWEVVYTTIDDYIYLDDLNLLQDKLSKNDNNFENTKFNDLYGFGITEILMNIMSRNGFSKYSTSAVILTCKNTIVTYYLSK